MSSNGNPNPLSIDDLTRLRQSLIAQIRRDFAHVSRSGGVSLHEAYVLDDWGSPEDRERARRLDTDQHWSEVNLQGEPVYGSALSFMDPIGFRYYYVAMMVGMLNADEPGQSDSNVSYYADSVLFHATPPAPSEWTTEELPKQFALFNDSQLRCVARFFVYQMEKDAEHPLSVEMSCDPLKRLWLRYLPGGERSQIQKRWPQLG